CVARHGAVHAGKASVSFGEIVKRGNLARSLTPEQLAKLPMKPAAERRMIGKATPARDIPGKTNGQGLYGLDAKVAGMVYARPKLPPTRNDSVVVAIDDSAAKAVPGYQKTIALQDPSGTVPGWVVVTGDSFIAANRACDLVKV